MAQLQEYKCPACGGMLEFDSKTQKLKCPYCDTEIDIEGFQELEKEKSQDGLDDMTWESQAGTAWGEGEEESLNVYVCKSCGGEITADANTAATSCPFCGNPVVMQGKLSGNLRPDYVIPFKMDKKAAKEAYKKHLQGKRLLPKVFKDENHIDEIKGMYVPFWLFDADVDASIRYKGTKTRFWSDSKYDYTETSYFSISRDGNIGFSHVPVDGSTKMADDLMESIEPFDFQEAVDFQTAYLAGYLADKYDVSEQESVQRANARIKASTEDSFRETIHGYESVLVENSNIRLLGGKAKYALYPVWILNTSWRGKNYTFAMNGQTGRMVGDLPVDKNALWRWRLGITAVASVITYLILALIM